MSFPDRFLCRSAGPIGAKKDYARRLPGGALSRLE